MFFPSLKSGETKKSFKAIGFSPCSAGHEHRPARDETQRGAQSEPKLEKKLFLQNYYYYYLCENAGFSRQVLLHHRQGHPRSDGDPGGARRKRIKVI